MADISSVMIKVAKSLGVQFTLHGRPLLLEEVFKSNGLMAGIAKRADQLASLCLGYGIGVNFEETEGAPLGTTVIFDELTPHAIRLFFMIDTLHELTRGARRGESVSLDQLLYD